MSVYFNPSSRIAAAAEPVETRAPAPAGLGNGQSTIASMAESESSGCCLSELFHCLMRPFVALWNCVSWFFSKEISEEELKITAIDHLKAKAEECIKEHCSEKNLAKMNAFEWKAATLVYNGGFVEGGGFLIAHCDRMSRETANVFQEKAIESLKNAEVDHLMGMLMTYKDRDLWPYKWFVTTLMLDEETDENCLKCGANYVLRRIHDSVQYDGRDDGQIESLRNSDLPIEHKDIKSWIVNHTCKLSREQREPIINFFSSGLTENL